MRNSLVLAVACNLLDRLLQLLVRRRQPGKREGSPDRPLRRGERRLGPLRLYDEQRVRTPALVINEFATAGLPLPADLVLGPPETDAEERIDDLGTNVSLAERFDQEE